jgi:hypothetical protein
MYCVSWVQFVYEVFTYLLHIGLRIWYQNATDEAQFEPSRALVGVTNYDSPLYDAA